MIHGISLGRPQSLQGSISNWPARPFVDGHVSHVTGLCTTLSSDDLPPDTPVTQATKLAFKKIQNEDTQKKRGKEKHKYPATLERFKAVGCLIHMVC